MLGGPFSRGVLSQQLKGLAAWLHNTAVTAGGVGIAGASSALLAVKHSWCCEQCRAGSAQQALPVVAGVQCFHSCRCSSALTGAARECPTPFTGCRGACLLLGSWWIVSRDPGLLGGRQGVLVCVTGHPAIGVVSVVFFAWYSGICPMQWLP